MTIPDYLWSVRDFVLSFFMGIILFGLHVAACEIGYRRSMRGLEKKSFGNLPETSRVPVAERIPTPANQQIEQ